MYVCIIYYSCISLSTRLIFQEAPIISKKNTHTACRAVIQYDKQRLGVIHNFTLEVI